MRLISPSSPSPFLPTHSPHPFGRYHTTAACKGTVKNTNAPCSYPARDDTPFCRKHQPKGIGFVDKLKLCPRLIGLLTSELRVRRSFSHFFVGIPACDLLRGAQIIDPKFIRTKLHRAVPFWVGARQIPDRQLADGATPAERTCYHLLR